MTKTSVDHRIVPMPGDSFILTFFIIQEFWLVEPIEPIGHDGFIIWLWHSIFWSGPSPRWTTINNLTMSFNKARVRPDSPYSIVYWVNTIYFQQLATFSRVWYLFDAKWQCPHLSGERIARILRGEHKPIYYPGGKLFISIPKNLLSTDGLP